MIDTLVHRGPDDAGAYSDDRDGIALGARRLAIVDLSEHGHQPMVSADGRYVLVYNGEIYNHQPLRADLAAAGYPFRGSSDTEVLTAAVQHWGLRAALDKANGMFALAVWDRRERTLSLARDRFGEKPLYYGWCRDVLLFGSELKALRAHPAFDAPVDRDVLTLYLRYNYVPVPFSIYGGIRKLPPASIVTFDSGARPGAMPDPLAYWSLAEVAGGGVADRLPGSVEEATDALEETLGAAVALRMRADVPLGAFLSGGIDSSLVVALMQRVAEEPVRTFTIAFDHADFDESADARVVADHLGTQHHEWRVSEADAMAVVPALPAMYDEPFADSSQIPTSVLAHLARGHVTVALSGDGGDELFGGYNRYLWAVRYWRRLEPVPTPLRRAAAGVLRAVPPGFWDGPFRLASRVAPRRTVRMPGVKMEKAARVLAADSLERTYHLLASITDDPASLVPGATEPVTAQAALGTPPHGEAVERMMYRDAVTYLPDDILTKVDRATMAWSLEGRMPFLDPNVAALAWRLPVGMKVHGHTGKWLLRKLLHRYVPPTMVERPKTGFGIPLAAWLRGDLRPWADDLLATDRLRTQGILDASLVGRLWSEHRSGRRDHQFVLWGLLMLEAWLEAQQEPKTLTAL